MHTPKLAESYATVGKEALSSFAHSAVRQTTASTFIAKGAELVVPLADALKKYDAFVETLDYPSPADTAQADELAIEVRTQLGRLAKRLNLDYTGQEPALLSSGLTMTSGNNAARPEGSTLAPPVISLTDGHAPGYVVVKFEGFTGSVQRLTRYTTDAALAPAHWLVATGGGRERELGPFASGTKVHVMAAPLAGSTTEPVYSAVVSRIVQ